MDIYVSSILILILVASSAHGKSLGCQQSCPPETQTLRPCNSTHPPLCSPCPFGSFISSSSPSSQLACTSCSDCGSNEYVAETCSAERDTVCKQCWLVAHTNPDYLLKCKAYYSHILELEKADPEPQKDSKYEPDTKERNLDDYGGYEMFGDQPAAVNFVDPDFGRNQQEKFPQNEDYEDFGGLAEEGLLLRGIGSYGSGDSDGFQINVAPEGSEESSGEMPGWKDDVTFTTSGYQDSTEDSENATIAMLGSEGVEPNEGAVTAAAAVPVVGIIIAAVTAGIVCFFVGFFINKFKCMCAGGGKEKKKGEYMAASTIDDGGTYKHQTELDFLNHNGSRQPEEGDSHSDSPGRLVVSEPILEQDEPSSGLLQDPMAGVGSFLQGRYQSPVDIVPEEAETDDTLEKNPLRFQYNSSKPVTITNTGNTVKACVEAGSGCELRGGPLGDLVYGLDHVHVHWGSSDERGSEHTVAGRQFSAELHLVHWNMTDYGSFEEASRAEGGLAVLAVLLDVGDEQPGLSAITDRLPHVQYKGESVEAEGDAVDFQEMLPKNCIDYWTYTGSLTLPPYHENVTWIVFKQPVEVAPEQMHEFRKLVTYERDEGHEMNRRSTAFLVDNFRSTQPMEGRVIRASFL